VKNERINTWKSYITEEDSVEVTALPLSYWEYKQRKGIEGNDYSDELQGYMVKSFSGEPAVFLPAYFFDYLFECIDRWRP
jgi:hypothetical protein